MNEDLNKTEVTSGAFLLKGTYFAFIYALSFDFN